MQSMVFAMYSEKKTRRQTYMCVWAFVRGQAELREQERLLNVWMLHYIAKVVRCK